MAGPAGTPSEPTPGSSRNAPGSSTGASSPGTVDRAQDAASRVAGRVQETASRLADTAQDAAAPAIEQASNLGGKVVDQATEQVSSRLDMGKDYAVDALGGVAQALRQTGQHLRQEGAQPMLAEYADAGAERLERFSGQLRQRSADELVGEVEGYARRNPTMFAGGAFVLGLLAARFFRSSAPRRSGPPMMTGGSSGTWSAQPRPAPTVGTTTRPSYPSSAPGARTIPASPDWTPSAPRTSSAGTSTSPSDAMGDQLTPIPGSLSSPSGASTGASGSGASQRPEPQSSAGGTSSSLERPGPGSER